MKDTTGKVLRKGRRYRLRRHCRTTQFTIVASW